MDENTHFSQRFIILRVKHVSEEAAINYVLLCDAGKEIQYIINEFAQLLIKQIVPCVYSYFILLLYFSSLKPE